MTSLSQHTYHRYVGYVNRKARRRQCIIINKGLWVGNGVWVRSRLHYLPQTSSVNTKPKVTANAFDSVRQGPIPGNDAPKRWQPWVRCFAVPCCIGLAFVASRRIPFRFPTFLATTKNPRTQDTPSTLFVRYPTLASDMACACHSGPTRRVLLLNPMAGVTHIP